MPHFYPLLPSLLILCLAALCCWATIRLARRLVLPPRRRLLLLYLAVAAIVLVAFMLLNLGLTFTRKGGQEAKLALLLDRSASMGIQDMADGASRYAVALQSLHKLYDQTDDGWTKQCYLFGMDTQSLSEDKLGQHSPEGGTGLEQALATVREEMGPGVTAVIISDGIFRERDAFAPPAGMSLYAVAVGTECDSFPDLGLGEIQAPTMMRAGDGCDFTIPVEMHGYAGERDIPLTITIDGRPAATELHRKITPGQTAVFSCRTDFKEAGIHTIDFALPQLPDEVSYLNNRQTLQLEVRDDRRETLLCYPVLNAGFRPLLRMMGGQDVMALYKLNNKDIWQAVTAPGQGGYFTDGFPATADALKEIDLLILGSSRAQDFSPIERAVLAKYTEEGGTLILMAGNDGAFDADGDETWATLMPAAQSECHLLNGTFQAIVPPQENSSLAELARQASTLTSVNAVEHLKETTTSLLDLRGERDYPLLLSMPYGKGRVFALLTNPIVCWGGSAENSETFRRFWTQLLAEADDGHNEHLKVELTGHILLEGKRIGITATPPDDTYSIQASFRPDNSDRVIPITLQRGEKGVHSGRVSTLKYAQGTLTVTAQAPGKRQYQRFFRLAAPQCLPEHTDIHARPDNFLGIIPPQHLHTPESISALADELSRLLRQDTTEREFHPAFETPYLLALLMLLLMLQWFLRRHFGLF